MTTGSPVRTISGHFLALLLAAGLLVPTVVFFCAVHKTVDKSPAILATGLIVRVYSSCIVIPTPIESFDPNIFPSLVQEQAAHNSLAVAQNIEPEFSTNHYMSCDSYDGLASFGAADPVIYLNQSIVQLISYFFNEMPMQTALVVSGFVCLWT